MYGDYYVAAFNLGGDAGAFVSVDSDQTTEIDKTSITVALKSFFSQSSHTEEKINTSHKEHLDFAFAGYDTLDGLALTHRLGDGLALSTVQNACSSCLIKASELTARVSQAIENLGLEKSHLLPIADCGRICRSGLVVQLLLAPFSWLREYQVAIRGRNNFT